MPNDPMRTQARIDRDDLDQVLLDLGCEKPWNLSTPQAVATLFMLASTHREPIEVKEVNE